MDRTIRLAKISEVPFPGFASDSGCLMRKGEMEPFKDNMLVGNIFEIEAVGKESEDIGGLISPEVLTFGKII